MSAPEQYAKAIAPFIARPATKTHPGGANYSEMCAGTGLSYGQVAHGLRYLNMHAGVNGKPLRRDQDPINTWARRYWVATSHDEVTPHVRYRTGYMTTMAEGLEAVVNNTVGAFGSNPAWMRLQIDVGRVVQDLHLINVP